MKRTVFVVGAGASTDFGLVLGLELAESIRVKLNQDFGSSNAQEGPIAKALEMRGLRNEHVVAAHELRGALVRSKSVDHALYTLRGRQYVAEIGKIAIAIEILNGESRSQLATVDPRTGEFDRHHIHNGLIQRRGSWLADLTNIILGDRQPEEFDTAFDSTKFVTFNYDRCIEQYVYCHLRDVGSMTHAQASSIVKRLPILHVYGHLGVPQFMGGPPITDFGAKHMMSAVTAADSIKTYIEGAEDGTIAEVRRLVSEAERIVLLGFGFDPLNVKVLFPPGLFSGQALCGTNLGADRELFTRFVQTLLGAPHTHHGGFLDATCSEFIRVNAKTLVAG